MRQILKYNILNIDHLQGFYLPTDFKFLSVQNQRDDIVFWIIGTLTKPKRLVNIQLVNTGAVYQLHKSFGYLGTVQLQKGTIVRHIFIQNRKVTKK